MGVWEYIIYPFKKNPKAWLLFLILIIILLVISEVKADWLDDGSCQINTDCIISGRVVNETTNIPVSDSICNLSVYDINSTFLFTQNFTNLTDGFYNTTINMNGTGTYPSFMLCQRVNDTDIADVSFIVSDPNYNNYLYLFLLLIPLVIFIIGQMEGYYWMTAVSGMSLVLYGIAVYMDYFPRFESNLITNAFSLVIIAIGLYLIGYSSIKMLGGIEQ